MSLRRLFAVTFVAWALAASAVGGFVAWREASRAVQAELDRRATWVAGAAAETGFQSSLLLGLEPGFEDERAWTSTQARLQRLRRYVREAYILDEDNTALVSTFPPDSIPIGTPLRFLDAYHAELSEARSLGNATTPQFTGSDGLLYIWGFAQLEQSGLILAVLMPADYLAPLARLRQNLLLGTLLAAVLAGVLAILLAARLAKPLERLSRVALRIQRGHMEEPVAEERGVEVGRLSRAMERMRRGILTRDEQLRLMLAQVAHEIRNPLGGMELFASAAADTEDPVERARLLGRVRGEVTALNAIIDDFLTFARPIAPLREASELVRAELEERGGRLDVSLPEEPMMARVGPEHAKRAALNLLRNAAQVADHVQLAGRSERGEVVISIRDDGPGVPRGFEERIFEPFVTDKEQGAGLGLAIVRKVAEVHGGRVELIRPEETNGSAGAEFRIYFPGIEDLSAAAPPSADHERAP